MSESDRSHPSRSKSDFLRGLAPGELVELEVEPEAVHLFDARTELRLGD